MSFKPLLAVHKTSWSTELFKIRRASNSLPSEAVIPAHSRTMARPPLSASCQYLLKYFSYEDLVIYEIGAGNGTLAMDILDYIRSA